MELRRLHGQNHDLHDRDHVLLTVEAIGKLSRDGLEAGADPLRDMLGDEVYGQGLLLSLQKCEYLDSSGVEWLLHCHARFQRAGGKMVVHSAKPKVMQLLRMMRMEMVLHLAADAEKAKTIIKGEDDHPDFGEPIP